MAEVLTVCEGDSTPANRRSKQWTNRVSADLAELRRILRKKGRNFDEDEILDIAKENSLIVTDATLRKLKSWFGGTKGSGVDKVRLKDNHPISQSLSETNYSFVTALCIATDSEADDIARLMISLSAKMLMQDGFMEEALKEDSPRARRAALNELAPRLTINLLLKTDLTFIGAKYCSARKAKSNSRKANPSSPS